METKMTHRSLTLAVAFATLLATAAFAGSNGNYSSCMSRDKPSNGVIPCVALLDETQVSEDFQTALGTRSPPK
jgi:hypothetical protein